MQAINRQHLTGAIQRTALLPFGFRSGVTSPPPIVLVPALLVGLAMALPIVYLVIRSAGASEQAWDLLFRFRTLQTLGRTVLLITTVTTFSALIAVPLAWLTTRSDLPLRKMWTVLVALPLVIPSFVGAFLFVSALGPRGLLQQMLSGPFGVERLPGIYGLTGATLVLVLLSYPYLFLTVRSAFMNLDPAIEESARSLGHGPWSTFMRVTLPQLRPSIAAGSLLVALYTLSDFGAVSLMRYNTFTWSIYQQYQSSFDRSIAAVLSLALVLMAVLILLMENFSQGRQKYYRTGAGAPRISKIVKLRSWKWPATGLFSIIVGVALILPMSILLFWLVRGVSAGEPLLLLWNATRSSLYVSIIAATVTVAMAIPLATVLVRYPSLLNRLLEPVSFTGYALPGVVVAIALVFFGANYVQPLYQTHALLIFTYAVLFFPVSLGAVRSSLLQINPRLEDAARGLGKNPLQVMLKITIPLIRSGVLTGAALVFLLTMKELPATLILGPIGFKTLATAVWSASSEAFFAQAAAPALMIILMSSLPMALIVMREKAK